MAQNEITTFFSNEGSRNEVRMRIVNKFSEETFGTGKKNNASRYIYFVETLKNGNRIFLKRPAQYHNGFDFLICIENTNFAATNKKNRNYPKHDDIINDLLIKRSENPIIYSQLYEILRSIFECHDVSESEYSNITFSNGLPVDLIIKTIKWFFIEQDIRYWNYSGRGMFWKAIPEKVIF